jgi:hypothetical protein
MTIPSKVQPIGAYDTFIHAMIIAAPGFGKTVFGGTAEKGLFLTTDPEGTVSAMAFGSTCKEWRIESWSELNEAYRYLRDGGIKEMDLKWVIIDNTSEAQNLGMFETMANARKRNAARDEFVPGIDDHQRSQLMMKDMVKKFHDLPVNILWTAWRKAEEDSEGETYFTSGIHGQQGLLAQTIQGYMNVVGFGEVVQDDNGNDVRRVYFSQHRPYMGKDRYVALGEARDNLTVPKMESIIEAAKKKHLAARAQRVGTPAAKATTTKAPVTRRAISPRKK